jgi:hypothetical protein
MRVDYTLPSLVPENLPELPGSVETPVTFRDQLSGGAATDMTVSWQQQFHLDSRPPDATHIGPPPRPTSLDLRDIDTERSRWRSMLAKHDRTTSSSSFQNANDGHSVRVMLDMLLDMQGTEDSIVSQNAALTRG